MPKLDPSTPPKIAAADYNYIRDKIKAILGRGGSNFSSVADPKFGYGQPLKSSAVSAGNEILKSQWDNLRYDLTNIKRHQDDSFAPPVILAVGELIEYSVGDPNFDYDNGINQAEIDKFTVSLSQSAITAPTFVPPTAVPGEQSYTGSWSGQAECTLTATFAGGYTVTDPDGTWTATSAEHACHFFNSGGKIRFTSLRSGGTTSAQNNAWTDTLSTIGTIDFGAITPAIINFYTLKQYDPLGVDDLAQGWQQVYAFASSSPYGMNQYIIDATCNCTDPTNSTGTADTIYFRVRWKDNYADPGLPAPGDLVDGTLTIAISELIASGTTIPTGTFTLPSATYSISSITAS